MQFASTGRGKCSRSGLVERVLSLPSTPPTSLGGIQEESQSPSFPLPCCHNGNADQDQRAWYPSSSLSKLLGAEEEEEEARSGARGGGERQKEPSSLTHPHRIRRHQKQDLSLSLAQKGSAESEREEMPGSLSVPSALPASPSLFLPLCSGSQSKVLSLQFIQS